MTAENLSQIIPYILLILGAAASYLNGRGAKTTADAKTQVLMAKFADELVLTLKSENESLHTELAEQANECKAQIEAMRRSMQGQIDELTRRLNAREGDGR